MMQEVILILMLIFGVNLSTVDQTDSNVNAELNADEATQVAQAFVDAGLEGFTLLQIRYAKEDIDTCNYVLTTVYKVQLESTGEIFEISSESNETDHTNCKSKRKLLIALENGGLTRVQHLVQDKNGQVQFEDIPIEKFRLDMEALAPEDFGILGSNYSYQFAGDEGVEIDAELAELHVRIFRTGSEYVVNIVGRIEYHGPVLPRKKPYPPKVLLSLLGGGSYSKMKRIKSN